MAEYEIEKNVPIPEGRGRSGNVFPFRDMEVGDSFFVATATEEEQIKTYKRLSSASSTNRALIKLGRAFTVRKVEGGVRCWRTK